MGIWSNAFKLPEHAEVNDQERALLLALAQKVRGRNMALAVSLAMESSRPLHNLGAQALVFLMPLLSQVFGIEEAEKAVKLLENPKAVDFFLKELNAASPNGANHVK
ncbi:MAG: hypothetical protein A2234_11035 [Elusimicrobia bacterium RIFOXYA2_FULL_58_8]|nr:MAG: hypothetical protein A2285_10385 [Elusimicrobia bacterium RIFOXYA12_FULL_57_11]OGS14552.1 MAG: hypothetical protein A2234_11035 [Elusimicrobia bacterium RIFOXYA2_FULL_58_8]